MTPDVEAERLAKVCRQTHLSGTDKNVLALREMIKLGEATPFSFG
jgi:hypothetical protein